MKEKGKIRSGTKESLYQPAERKPAQRKGGCEQMTLAKAKLLEGSRATQRGDKGYYAWDHCSAGALKRYSSDKKA